MSVYSGAIFIATKFLLYHRKAWMVYVLRTCGLGYAALEKLHCIIIIPKPVTSINLQI